MGDFPGWSYDHWKTSEPEEDVAEPVSHEDRSCDRCGGLWGVEGSAGCECGNSPKGDTKGRIRC
jgi:hypothetical protein